MSSAGLGGGGGVSATGGAGGSRGGAAGGGEAGGGAATAGGAAGTVGAGAAGAGAGAAAGGVAGAGCALAVLANSSQTEGVMASTCRVKDRRVACSIIVFTVLSVASTLSFEMRSRLQGKQSGHASAR